MSHIFDTCLTSSLCLTRACSDTIPHKIAGDTKTQYVQLPWRGQI